MTSIDSGKHAEAAARGERRPARSQGGALWGAVLAGVLLAGCGSRPTYRAPRPARSPAVRPGAGRPRGAPLLRIVVAAPAFAYRVGDRRGTPPAALRGLLEACVEQCAARGVDLRWDPRLVAAARTLAHLPAGTTLTPGALRFVLQAAGIPEPHARAGMFPLPAPRSSRRPAGEALASRDSSAAPVHERFCRRLAAEGFNRLGALLTPPPARRLVWVALESRLWLEPVPRHPALGGSVLLRGRLGPGLTAPRALLTGPGGRTRPVRLVAALDQRFHALVPLNEGAGVYQMELVAHGPDGPFVLANAPLFVGVPPPIEYLLSRSADRADYRSSLDSDQLERALWTRLQATRVEAGLRPLRLSIRLARVARAHAFAMCRSGRVQHVSPLTGTASDRVRAAGLKVSWVGENVGEGRSVADLDAAFQESPGHRAVRLSPRAELGGVGICVQQTPSGRIRLYATELYAH